MHGRGRTRVSLVQQSTWKSAFESMPLASGYLKAVALADKDTDATVEIEIVNFPGQADPRWMARRLIADGGPDIVGFSVLGWNIRPFTELSFTLKQVNPRSPVVFGGTHVSHQAERILQPGSPVDIIVNGEGEFTFLELLRWHTAGGDPDRLHTIAGISFRTAQGIVTTEARTRIDNLDAIPSPLLTGAIPLVDELERFRYDVALMETNRGCPYRCAFCYWGGAIGTRVREFSRERLRAELELIGRLGVETVVLCDANFGMRRADLEFVHDFLRTRNTFGYPRNLDTSWAKNKSAVFLEIVDLLHTHGVTTSFTFALQSLDDIALTNMHRRNMQINEWKALATQLTERKLHCYAELIWGLPGDTVESFMAGYDELADHIPRIATYPLLIIPNTEFDQKRDEFGLVTVRGAEDDFEYVLRHDTMSLEDNDFLQAFTFWARILGEHSYFRHIWKPLAELVGQRQSAVILGIRAAAEGSDCETARRVLAEFRPYADSYTVVRAVRLLFAASVNGRPAFIDQWWDAVLGTVANDTTRAYLVNLMRLEDAARPVYATTEEVPPLPVVEHDGERKYARLAIDLDWPIDELLAGRPRQLIGSALGGGPVSFVLRMNYAQYVDHHEAGVRFAGVAVHRNDVTVLT